MLDFWHKNSMENKPTAEQSLNILVQAASATPLNMQDNEKVRIAINVLIEALKPKEEKAP